jgi:hypothetical protein
MNQRCYPTKRVEWQEGEKSWIFSYLETASSLCAFDSCSDIAIP